MKKLKGVYVPAVTFFDEAGEIDFQAVKLHADFLIGCGVDGIVYLGTTGEFFQMTQAQKLLMIDTMSTYLRGKAKIIVGVGDTCIDNTLELIMCAETAKADAIIAVSPYYCIYDDAMVEAYYNALLAATDLPVIIYNIPVFTGFNIGADLLFRLLRKHNNLTGFKDTILDIEHLYTILPLKEEFPNFSLFCAYETQAYEMLKAGADGFINGTANIMPEFTVGSYRAAISGDERQLKSLTQKMAESAQVYEVATPMVLAIKEAVYQRIGVRGYEKLPGISLSSEKQRVIKEILAGL